MFEAHNAKIMRWGKATLKMLEADERIEGDSTDDWKAWKLDVGKHWVCGTLTLIYTSS